MKKFFCFLSLISALLLTGSCDYWGTFSFVIDNETDKYVRVSVFRQIQRYEDILPTYSHGEDYSLLISETDTVIVIAPHSSIVSETDAGIVGASFPTKYDTPRMYDVAPTWDLINYIVVGTDTLDAKEYSENKWKRSELKFECRYTLTLVQ
ncbi:MAG: hypothetical protein J5869_00890 [Bacteroidaceae bacterium]|nr:hypothetical protein [Bacteroidaceae bacterium]